MKGIAGGAWFGALLTGACGYTIGMIILIGIGALAAAAGWYDEKLEEEKAESWRANYPTYKY